MAEKKKTAAFAVNAPYGLNLRESPNGAVKTVLVYGTKVAVSEVDGDWCKVTANRKTGWVKGEYLTEEAV